MQIQGKTLMRVLTNTHLDCTGDIHQFFLRLCEKKIFFADQTDLDSADDVHGASEGCPDVEEYSYCSPKLRTQRPRYHKIRP